MKSQTTNSSGETIVESDLLIKEKKNVNKPVKLSKDENKVRRLWNEEEDEAISKLAKEYGTREWTLISRKLSEIYGICGRNGKQCRERWMNHINPQVNKGDIGDKEEELLFAAYKKYGTKWAEIAKEMPGRTDNIVKNHFYAIIRKQFRRIKKAARIKIPFVEDLSIKHLLETLKEFKLPISILSNKHIINEIKSLECQSQILDSDLRSNAKENELSQMLNEDKKKEGNPEVLIILNLKTENENENENENEKILKETAIKDKKIAKSISRKDRIFKVQKRIRSNSINKSNTIPNREVHSEKSIQAPLELKEENLEQNFPYKIVNPLPVYGYTPIPGLPLIEKSNDFFSKFINEPLNIIDNNLNPIFNPNGNISNAKLNLYDRLGTDIKLQNNEERLNQDFKKEPKGFKDIYKGNLPQIRIETINARLDSFNRINHNIFENNLHFDNSPHRIESQMFFPKNSPLSFEEFLNLNEELGSVNLNNKLCFKKSSQIL